MTSISRNRGEVDLLLLNASNYPRLPVYPYAFVQVSEIARRFGLRVRRFDFLGVPPCDWEATLADLLTESRPRMVGFHLRQVDSLRAVEYVPAQPGGPPSSDYFPADDTRYLIQLARTMAPQTPIAVGGFGFSTQPERLIRYLDSDVAVAGSPDPFFARFEDVLRGKGCETIPGLVHRRNGQILFNGYAHCGPTSELEYTEEIIGELERFYEEHGQGPIHALGDRAPTVAIEVMRGCPFRCYFCTEPLVKGRKSVGRDVDSVFGDVELLLRHGLHRFWFVASELNIRGSAFPVTLAERILRINEQRPADARIRWTGYLLPNVDGDALDLMFRSGYFVGGANDPLSLDDENLERGRVPYRSRHVVRYMRDLTRLAGATAPATAEVRARERQRATFSLFEDRMPFRPRNSAVTLQLFLGNAYATPQTIKRTIERLHQEGISSLAEVAGANTATRAFDALEPYRDVEHPGLLSVHRTGVGAKDLVQPTFHYPSFLLERLRTPTAVQQFLSFVAATLMSTAHRFQKNWGRFLTRSFDGPSLADAVEGAVGSEALELKLFEDLPALQDLLLRLRESPEETIEFLLRPDHGPGTPANMTTGVLTASIARANRDAMIRVLERLGIAHWEGMVSLSEYELLEHFYGIYGSSAELRRSVEDGLGASFGPFERFCLDYLIYINGVVIHPRWRSLLF